MNEIDLTAKNMEKVCLFDLMKEYTLESRKKKTTWLRINT